MSQSDDTRKVISLRSREPITIVQEEVDVEALQAARDEETRKDIEADLKAIDEFRLAVAKGHLCGVVLLARHIETGHFFHDLAPNFRRQPELHQSHSAMLYAAQLEELKLEFLDIAAMRPTLLSDEAGNITLSEIDPSLAEILTDEFEGDDE